MLCIKDALVQNPFKTPFKANVYIENEKIKEITQKIIENCEIIEANGLTLTPGLIDRHTHGGYGCNFNTCNNEELDTYLQNALLHGVTTVLPTIMTDNISQMKKQIALIKNHKSSFAKIYGIHLEGPFLNKKKKGIHPENCIIEPDIQNLSDFDTEFIKLITYAFENDKDKTFTKELLRRNIVLSIGHSVCNYNEAQEAFKMGINQITHAFNAINPLHHREPSLIGAALVDNNVYLEVIADLEHIHKAVLELILKTKPKDKVVLISDSLPISYSKDKEGIFGGEKIFYDGHKATSKDGVLAGSTLFLDDIYKKIKDFVEFKDFIGFTSLNPAKSLNISNYGKIEADMPADCVLWDKDYNVKKVFVDGTLRVSNAP